MDHFKVISFIAFANISTSLHAASLVDSIPILVTTKKVDPDDQSVVMSTTGIRNEADNNCDLADKGTWYCARTYRENEYLSDFKASPTLAEGGELKLGLARMEIDFGTDLRIPFSIMVADVTSETKSDQANAIKLLDPQQGINFGFEKAWTYQLGKVCETGKGSTATCVFGWRAGGRYISLKENETENSVNSYGGFITLENAWAFKIYKYNTNEETGYLRINMAGSLFSQNGGDSDTFFSGVADPNGNPMQFEENYASATFSVALYITKSINISYTKWFAESSSGLTDQETVSISFDILKFR